MTPDVSKNVLKQIKKKHIKPKPKWQFLLKNWVLWGSLGMVVLIGGLATSVIIFRIHSNDWDIPEHLETDFHEFFFETLPYFWIALLAIFIFIAHYNFKHTKIGYKYGSTPIIGASLILSVLLGLSFFGIGAASHLEDVANKHLPFYENFEHGKRLGLWLEDDGLLAGEVLSINEDTLKLEDISGEEWDVDISELPEDMKERIKVGTKIGIFGDKIDEETFKAEKIRPWRGHFPASRTKNGHRDGARGNDGPRFLKENHPAPRTR